MYDELIQQINEITKQNLIYKKDFKRIQDKINSRYESGLLSFDEFLNLTTYNKKMMQNVDDNYFLIR